MSIELNTGLPGNGKTLFTIWDIKARAEREGREVYYHGIAELTLPWHHLEDPKKWFECPPGSIVVIDEAQQIYRNRSIRAEAPLHVTELETHRHLGIDLILITQHPSLIDPAVRKLTQTHRHLVRIFGMQASTVHTWNGVKDNCDKQRADSMKTKFIFDKSLYGVYKSAELHTVKRAIPMRVLFLCLLPLFLLAAAYAVYALMVKPKTQSSVPALVQAGGQVGEHVGGSGQQFDPLLDARRYVHSVTPRVQGIAHSAPKYDDLTKPQSVPVPAMCIKRGTRCQCYSQQATKLEMPLNACLDIAHNGYFEEFDPNGRDGRRGDSDMRRNGAVGALPFQAGEVRGGAATGPSMIVIPYTPEPSRYARK